MQFAHAIRLDVDQSTGKLSRNREVRNGVLDLHPSSATWCHRLLLLREFEDILLRSVALRRLHSFLVCVPKRRRCNGRFVHVGVLRGHLRQQVGIHAEVLRNDPKRRMCEPIRKHECGAGRIEVSVREDKQDLETVSKGLDAVWYTRWEAAL